MQNNLTSLKERLRHNMEQERQNTEALMQESFNALSQSLRQSSQNALHTTQDAILKTIKQRLALGWSLGIVLVTALASGGLAYLSLVYLQHLQGEIVQLTEQKEVLEANCNRIWRQFKGLVPYSAEGKDYLLTPPGWTIVQAGTLEQTRQDAWQIVRK